MSSLVTMDYNGFPDLLTEFLMLLGISLVMIWIIIVVSANVQHSKETPKRAYNQLIFLSFQNALIWYMIFFSLYFGVFLAYNGNYSFNWERFPLDVNNTYLRLIPQLLIYLIIIGVYIFLTLSLNKKLKIR